MIKNLFVAFSKACKNGFPGFIEWIQSLLKKGRKNFDDVLEYITDLEELIIQGKVIKGLIAQDIKRWLQTKYKISIATLKLLEELGLTIVRNIDDRLKGAKALATPEGFIVKYGNDNIFEGTGDAIKNFSKKIENINKSSGKSGTKKYLDEFIEAVNDFTKVPKIKYFSEWFENIPTQDFIKLWENQITQEIIKRRIRHPGGLHEWLMVSRTDTFKKWGVSMDEIKNIRSKITDVTFVNPKGKHGGFGSTRAHNEILDLIDSSENYLDYKRKLINWAEKRLEGGISSLPKIFFD